MESSHVHILLVEDNDLDARRIQVLLSGKHQTSRFHFRQVKCIADALSTLEDEHFDLILLDLMLPDSSGIDTFIQVLESSGSTPIVVLTMVDDESVAARAVREGAQDYLIKSDITAELLVRAIRYAISRQKLREELRQRTIGLEASESNFRNVLAKSVDGIIVVDGNGNTRFVNTAAEELLGRSAADLLGQNLCIPLVKDDTTELSIVRPDGEISYLESRIVETRWEHEPACIVSLRDITRQKRTEEELEAARRREEQEKDIRFGIVVNTMDEGVLVVNGDGLIHFVNSSLQRLLEIPSEQLIGRPVERAVDDECWHDFFRSFKEIPEYAKRGAISISTVHGLRHLNVHVEGIRPANSANTGFVCVLTDITQFKEMDELKSELIGFVSHELKSPLTVIKGYVSTMLRHGIDKIRNEATEFLQSINNEISRLARLTDAYLDISRIERGQPIELIPEEFDVRELVDGVMTIEKAAAAKCTFSVAYEDDVRAIWADRDKLSQVLHNLLSNGGKNSPQGGAVRLTVGKDDGAICFSVHDEGKGIPQDALKRLFTPFFRVDPRGGRRERGSGLGLYLSKRLVEAHGGKIGITTEQGKGTTAYFSIPLRILEKTAV